MTLWYCTAVLFLGGALKGVIGLGLPQVGVPLIALALGLKGALGVVVLPIIASNIAQSFDRQYFLPVIRRFWPLLLALFCFAVMSTRMFGAFPERWLLGIIGASLIVFPTIAFLRPKLRLTTTQELWAGPVTGAVSGILGGVSGLPGPTLMIYLACLRLPKDEFVVAVSMMFLTSAIGLELGLATFAASPATEILLSLAACIPVFIGMWLGAKMRMQMNERSFARLVLATYIGTGVSFILKAAL